jgi:SAM-dependent methyltransferase
MSEAPQKHVIDVERLVDDLKERVARERAAGAYVDDLSGIHLEVPRPERVPELAQQFDLAGDTPRVRFRPELGFSSKPVIGPVITLVKRFLLRLLHFVLDDLARQADAAVRRLEAALTAQMSALAAETAARERLDADLRGLDADLRVELEQIQGDLRSARAQITAEVGAREAVQVNVRDVATRLARLDEQIERLKLSPRLARLERRSQQQPAAASPASTAPGEQPPPLPAPVFDYETFEARFRPEESVRERQQSYVELLHGRERVVDLGCGRGELIEMLGEQGVPAYGVEIDRDFISYLEDKGIEVVAKDAVAHLAELEPGAVDGIVASHLVEHLPPAALTSLVSLAAEKIGEGGILILETPNPESLVAGSVNFHRDLTHVRPIHPDTLSFLCESAGFSQVEIQRLSPVPDDERLPKIGDEKIDDVVDQLNELLYGYQDYAIVARR